MKTTYSEALEISAATSIALIVSSTRDKNFLNSGAQDRAVNMTNKIFTCSRVRIVCVVCVCVVCVMCVCCVCCEASRSSIITGKME